MIFVVFIFGLIIGSFINALEYSLRKKKKISRLHSECPKCHHKLTTIDLIPLVSYFALQGRCRYCKKPISAQYPIVELFTAIIFALLYNRFMPTYNLVQGQFKEVILYGQIITFVFWLFIASCLILITITDIKEMIIPDEIIYPAIIISLIYALTIPFANGRGSSQILESLPYLLLALAVSSGFFFLLIVVSKGNWMGGGDVKLAAVMALALSWPNILVAMMVAFILGSIFGVGAIVLKKKKFADVIPFGPFLVIGTIAAALWGDLILNFYFFGLYNFMYLT